MPHAVQQFKAQQMSRRYQGTQFDKIWIDEMCTPREPYGLPMGSNVQSPQPSYTLDQLWPHDGFVKPIHELATPHLRNISEMFKDERLFYVSTKGKTRTGIEVAQLQNRVALVRKVLQEREAALIGQTRADLQRRVNDTKMRMSQINTRRYQAFNGPDFDELYQMNLHAMHLINDLQIELGL